jgi:Ca-activated chloride channel family protein
MLQLFAHPGWLLLLLALPGLVLLLGYARRRRRLALTQLGQAGMMRRMQITLPSGRRWQNSLMLFSLLFLILACAQPHWGSEAAETRTPGHDLVVVLDVSRSMLAEQPTRRTLATRALKDLAITLGRDGSTRIGLVLFAGRPRILTPLTLDYEQFQNVLRDVDDDVLPPEIWPDKNGQVASGTRIGAALEKAVQLLGNNPARLRDILVLSDGDDPKNDQ